MYNQRLKTVNLHQQPLVKSVEMMTRDYLLILPMILVGSQDERFLSSPTSDTLLSFVENLNHMLGFDISLCESWTQS